MWRIIIVSLNILASFVHCNLDPDQYLADYGYLPNIQYGQSSPVARKAAIRKFQRFTNIPETGRLDAVTLSTMEAPRCGVEDVRGYAMPIASWSKRHITWRLMNYTPDMSVKKQRLAITRGINYWTTVTNIFFTEVAKNDQADITISFGRGDHHQTCKPFDGPGGVLAHAYYPEDGRLHFDEDETWTEGIQEGTNLRLVTFHEMGHALGLAHSNDPSAIMNPMYQGYWPHRENNIVPADDTRGIQKLYGAKDHGMTRRPLVIAPIPTISPRQINPCTDAMQAMFTADDGVTYAFRNGVVAKMVPGAAQPVFHRYYDLFDIKPNEVDAAFFVHGSQDHGAFLLSGALLYRYHYDVRSQTFALSPGYPRDNSVVTRYPTRPNAAFVDFTEWINIYEGDRFVFYNIGGKEVRSEKIVNYHGNLPNYIDSATKRNGIAYFFKGAYYYTLRKETFKVDGPFRKDKKWMGC